MLETTAGAEANMSEKDEYIQEALEISENNAGERCPLSSDACGAYFEQIRDLLRKFGINGEKMIENQATKNTDRVLHEDVDCRIILTAQHSLGIDVGGMVIVRDPLEWHRMAREVADFRAATAQDSQTEFPFERIANLAKACPSDYPGGSHGLRGIRECVDLSESLAEAGYTFLAKAVLGGIVWSRKIASGHSLQYLEKDAASPEYSWNDPE